MKRTGVLNLILVLSFLLSNLGISTTNTTINTSGESAGLMEKFWGKIENWIEALQVVSIETSQRTNLIAAPSTTHTPWMGIAPTIEPSSTNEPTILPTNSPTIALTVTPTYTPTTTYTPEPTRTQEPTTPAEEIVIPTQIVTGTVYPIQASFPVSFTLNITPTMIRAGDVISGSWIISVTRGIMSTMDLVLTLPYGILPAETDKDNFNWESGELIFPITDTIGNFSWYINPEASGPFTVLAEVVLDRQSIFNASYIISEREPDIINVEGGTASGFNEHLLVNFPYGALPEDAEVTIKPATRWEQKMGAFPVNITAISRITGQSIHQLYAPVSITIDYGQLGIRVKDESSLTLFHFNEFDQSWTPLGTQVDSDQKRLIAWTDQLSPFDLNVQDWEAARLPGMESFQVSTFTGAATYNLPIQVPPGPGGLQPSLELSYNSQIVDAATSRTQASWVGMGWSLDTGYIQRNMNKTMDYLGDDTFSLSINGIGGTILPIADQDGDGDTGTEYTVDYQLASNNYWRIRRYVKTGLVGGYPGDFSYWVVYDKIGTQYYFGNYADGGMGGHAWYPAYPNGCSSINIETWRWSLTRVRNISGKELTYTYQAENTPKYKYGCSGYQANTTLAVYPQYITYANNRYRIEFITSNNRTDYDGNWELAYSIVFYMRLRLSEIRIENDADGNGTFETLVKKYLLNYQDGLVFPGVTWRTVGLTTSLKSITEYGLNGANHLPTISFTYGDVMHLTTAENGYGGEISYTYEEWHASESMEDDIANWGEGNWVYPHTPPYYCDDPSGSIKPIRLAEVFHPGWVYKFYLDVHTPCNSPYGPLITDMNYGIHDGTTYLNATESETKGMIGADPDYYFQAYLSIPATASQAQFWVSNNGQFVLHEYEVLPLVTRWRVITKTLIDNVTGTNYTTSYDYVGAAVNDTTNSQYVIDDPDGSNLYTKPYSEFRGHSHVTETGLDDKVVETWFFQNDIFKGQTDKSLVRDTSGNKYSMTDSGYLSTEFPTVGLPHPQGQGENFYRDLKIYWLHTEYEENLYYNGNTSYVKSRTNFYYYTSDQEGTQYGNLTRSINYYYSGSAWVAYRGSRTQYYPNVSNGTPEDSRFLTGLPGYTNVYQCPGGCDWAANDLVSSQWNLYDGSAMYSDLPIDGSFTGSRTMTHYDISGNPMYADTSYTYDTWGNRISISQYSDYTDVSGFGYGSYPQTTTTCYGWGTAPSCNSDGYNTYRAWEMNALGQTTRFVYDKALGVPTSITDANNVTTYATYDEFGRMLTIRRPGDSVNYPTVIMSYHEASAPFPNNPFWTEAKQRITVSTYFTIRKYYNGIGQLLQSQVVGATIGSQTRDILTDTFYDAGGRAYQQTIPYDVATGSNYHTRNTDIAHTETTYDTLGRISTILATDGTPTSYSYSDGYVSNVPYLYTMETNPRENDTTTRSDVWGRVVRVTPPTGPDVQYTYDAANNMLTVARGGSTTTLSYDFGGRKTSMSDPDMGMWYYAYDALGNLTRQRDAKNQRICLYYDDLNRLTGKHHRSDDNCPTTNPSLNVQYWYDDYNDNVIFNGYTGGTTYAVGRRTGMLDSSGRSMWTFDSRGRLIREQKVVDGTGGGTFVTRWGYNSADMMSWSKYPSNNNKGEGEMVNYTYLPQMMLDSVSGTSTYVYNTDYDAAGRVDLRQLGSSGLINQDYSYFDWDVWCGAGRLQQIQTGIDEPTSLQYLQYTYDANGNVLTIQDYKAGSPQTQTFTYDALDRLSTAKAENGTYGYYSIQSYTYNGTTGNLSSKAGVSLTYGDSNHDHAVTLMEPYVDFPYYHSFTYDANGNQITRNVGGNSYTLSYDAENRLVSVSGAATATFVYDGDGNRVKGSIGSVTTIYIGSYFEWTGSTSTMKKYYYAGSTLVAMRKGSSTLNYLLGDHLGSTAITTDSSGVKVAEIRYYPWGTERYTYGTTPTTYHFTGQRLESYINLYWYGSRWFDPALGRFISPDPIVPGTGEGGNPNAVGYLGSSTYSPLIVDYHENQFLYQLNTENEARTQNINNGFSYIPINSTAFDRYAYSFNNPIRYTDPTGHCPFCIAIPFVGIPGVGWVILGVAVVATVAYYAAGGPEAVANGINQAGEAISNGVTSLFSRGDGGAKSSAQHLAMLLGFSVAGFAPHPGMPDPEGRDRKHDVEGLRNDLRNIQRNMRSGETVQDYLARQNWSEAQIQDYIQQVNNYVENVLSTDMEYYGVSQDLADDLLNLVNSLGMQ
jgi:RHS repeat-associated protein